MINWPLVKEYFRDLALPDGWELASIEGNIRIWVDAGGEMSVTAIISRPQNDIDWLCLMVERKNGTPTMDDVTFVIRHWGWPGRRWIFEFSPGWEEDIPPKILQMSCPIGEDILSVIG